MGILNVMVRVAHFHPSQTTCGSRRASPRALICRLLALGAMCGLPLWAEETAITEARLLQDVRYLASDELEGRGVGSAGLNAAADFIRDEFAKIGLNTRSVNGGAFQIFTTSVSSKLGDKNTLEFLHGDAEGTPLQVNVDFRPLSLGGSGPFSGELAFAGYAIESPQKKYDDFAGLDLQGKVAIVLRRVPRQNEAEGPFSGPHGGVSSEADLSGKISRVFAHGAAAMLLVNDAASSRKQLDEARQRLAKQTEVVAAAAVHFDAQMDEAAVKTARKELTAALSKYRELKDQVAKGEPDPLITFGYGGDGSGRTMPVLQVTRKVADRAVQAALDVTLSTLEEQIDRDLKPHSAVLDGWTCSGTADIDREVAEIKNVIGVLEGDGPLANETIVVGAHYDHVGRGGKGSLAPGSTEIHNGADDNASGVACLIELARRLAALPQKLPRRVVFIAFTGEELGLLGSERYVHEPVFPLDTTVAMLNMDMVGRLADHKLTVFGVDTSTVWRPLLDPLGQDQGFKMIYKPEGFGPSDHAAFYGQRIPVLHFFTGNHGDYHRPTDDWERINAGGMRQIVDLLDRLVVQLARSAERPPYVAVKGNANPLRDTSRPYFGSIPDFGSEQPGYALGAAAPDSPAEKAGLKGGDRIVQLGPHRVENLDDFDQALRKFTPGDTVDVTLLRGSERLVLKVTLDKPR